MVQRYNTGIDCVPIVWCICVFTCFSGNHLSGFALQFARQWSVCGTQYLPWHVKNCDRMWFWVKLISDHTCRHGLATVHMYHACRPCHQLISSASCCVVHCIIVQVFDFCSTLDYVSQLTCCAKVDQRTWTALESGCNMMSRVGVWGSLRLAPLMFNIVSSSYLAKYSSLFLGLYIEKTKKTLSYMEAVM